MDQTPLMQNYQIQVNIISLIFSEIVSNDSIFYDVDIQCKRSDIVGREYSDEKDKAILKVAYVKFVNVPSEFDIGCSESIPNASYIDMNYVGMKNG
jgi:hypothetical protein